MSTDCICVNFHTPTLVDDFLESIDGQYNRLVIVNNEVTMDDMLASDAWLAYPNVTVLSNEENLGYARAVNQAAAYLGDSNPAATLAIFNSDVLVPLDGLARMEESLWERDEVVIAGPLQVDSQTRITHAGIFGTPDKPKHRAWRSRNLNPVLDVRDDAVTVAGSAFFVKRWWWDEATNCATYQDGVKEVMGCSAEGAFLPTMHYY